MLPYREYKSDSVLGPMLSAELTVDKALGTKVNGASITDAVLDEDTHYTWRRYYLLNGFKPAYSYSRCQGQVRFIP